MPDNTTILNFIGRTPLVRLQHMARDCKAPIFAKCEHLNPGGSVKDRIAKAIVEDAETRGVLRPRMTMIEATAGNTGLGLAMIAASRGYRLVCVMPEKMSIDKRNVLATLGAQVVVTPNAPPNDPNNFINRARQLAVENGWFNTEQFTNPANPRIHEFTTGPEILEQCNGAVGAFVAGCGTGGTLTGVGRFLKKHCPRCRIVLADPVGSRLAHFVSARHPDVDAPYQVEGIGGSVVPTNLDLNVIDDAVRIDDDTSFQTTAQLWKHEGIYVGGSSGTAVAAAMHLSNRGDVEGPVVALLADGWDRYRSKPWFFQAMQQS